MPRSPAAIIIARHGARLDAADKTWHLTSPTPYDPPLTYGGWTQSRALGTRIAGLLHAREEADDAAAAFHGRSHSLDGAVGPALSQSPATGRKRKHRVIVHASPFLRCVQTAVAISAGIAQFQASSPSTSRSSSPRRRASLHSAAVNGRGSDWSPASKVIPEAEDDPTRNVLGKALKKRHVEKTSLRIDAFLGEWLSPDYFDLITPPPNSTMMVAGAKADLLRRGEYVDARPESSHGAGHFPGGWGSDKAPGAANGSNGHGRALSGLGSLAQALPLRDRASSQGSASIAVGRSRKRDTAIPTTMTSDAGTYRAPVPMYAISPAESIPRGYVAHARDACVEVDYQWDSMRDPQQWGDGGEYGEEWSAMHKRFRGGLNKMISWYKEHGAGGHPDEAVVDTRDEDEDEELVLVLVTHGAGCNALIGALTGQPVLLDVGMASLTMAIRKDVTWQSPRESDRDTPSPFSEHRRSGHEIGLSDEYDVALVASTEHLRVGADPAKVGPLSAAQFMDETGDFRRRYPAHAAAGSPIDNVGEPARRTSSSLGSMRRSSTIHTLTKSYAPSPGRSSPGSPMFGPSTGLWSKPTSKDGPATDGTNTPSADFSLNPDDAETGNAETEKEKEREREQKQQQEQEQESTENAEAEDDIAPLPPNIGRKMSQHGLWGSAPSGARNERERGPKRRWTINERDA